MDTAQLSHSTFLKPTLRYNQFRNDGCSCPGIPNGLKKFWGLGTITASSSDAYFVLKDV